MSAIKSVLKDFLVQRNGQQLGPFKAELVQQLLAQGEIQPTDFIWFEGLLDWIQLDSIVDVPKPMMSPPPFRPIAIAGKSISDNFETETVYLQMKKSLLMAIFLNVLWAGWGIYFCKGREGRWIAGANIIAFILSFFALGVPCLVLCIWASIICKTQVEVYNRELQQAIRQGTLDGFKKKYKIASAMQNT